MCVGECAGLCVGVWGCVCVWGVCGGVYGCGGWLWGGVFVCVVCVSMYVCVVCVCVSLCGVCLYGMCLCLCGMCLCVCVCGVCLWVCGVCVCVCVCVCGCRGQGGTEVPLVSPPARFLPSALLPAPRLPTSLSAPAQSLQWNIFAQLKRNLWRDFPGGPVAEALCSQCRGPRFDPWSGN